MQSKALCRHCRHIRKNETLIQNRIRSDVRNARNVKKTRIASSPVCQLQSCDRADPEPFICRAAVRLDKYGAALYIGHYSILALDSARFPEEMSRQCLFLSGRKKSADVVEQLSWILMRHKDARAAAINHAVSLNQKPGPSAAAGRCRTFHSPAPFSPEVRSAAGAPGHVAVALQLAGQGGRPRLEAAGHQEGGDALQAFPAPPARRSAARACPACGTEQHSTCTVARQF